MVVSGQAALGGLDQPIVRKSEATPLTHTKAPLVVRQSGFALAASFRWVTGLSARRSVPLIAWFLVGPLCLIAAEAETPPRFETDVLPILTAHCLKCHGLEAAMVGLDLRTPALILRGGDNGSVGTKGSAGKSLLYKRISTATMPPSDELKLREEQVETIRRWIDAGLPASRTYGNVTKAEAPEVSEEDRQYWAFQKLARTLRPDLSAGEALDPALGQPPQYADRNRQDLPADGTARARADP